MDEMKAVIIQIQERLGALAATCAACKRLQLRTSAIRRKKIRSLFVWLCLLCLCIGTAAVSTFADDTADPNRNAVPKYIHLPVTEPDTTTSSGVKTTWSCVWFGSYPSEEVVDSSWAAVDDYALADGDVIRDDKLYKSLTEADWKKDDTVTLDGVSYLRVKSEKSNEQESSREQHYHWDNDHPWHFFRISPMRWRVLDFSKGKMLLLSDRMPDSMPFHDADEDVTWEDSTLRSWLNGYNAKANLQGVDYTGKGFIDQAFLPEERKAILTTHCDNLANKDYDTYSGGDTGDFLFLLSNAEVFEGPDAGKYGFFPGRDYDDPAKRFTSTVYAKSRGAWWSPVEEYAGNSFWFMRTSGYTPRSITYICDFGFVYSKGTLVTCSDAGVLPAMWIDPGKAKLSDAGETRSTDIMHQKDKADTGTLKKEINNPVIVKEESAPGGEYTIWNAVMFGHYPQTEIEKTSSENDLFRKLEKAAKKGEESVTLDGVQYKRLDGRWFRFDPIVWRVLEVTDQTALLMADRGLDCMPYHSEYEDVFWEDSGVRGWLNGTPPKKAGGAEGSVAEGSVTEGSVTEGFVAEESVYGTPSFLETAFTEEERAAIVRSVVPNSNNHYFGTGCGSGTRDRVFLLSEEETFSSEKAEKYGFRPSDAVGDTGRRILPTSYATARGAWQSDKEETSGIGFWLLRTNGYTEDNVVYVGEKGYLYNRGIPVTCADACIVPAIRVELDRELLTVTDDIKGY